MRGFCNFADFGGFPTHIWWCLVICYVIPGDLCVCFLSQSGKIWDLRCRNQNLRVVVWHPAKAAGQRSNWEAVCFSERLLFVDSFEVYWVILDCLFIKPNHWWQSEFTRCCWNAEAQTIFASLQDLFSLMVESSEAEVFLRRFYYTVEVVSHQTGIYLFGMEPTTLL